MHFTSLRARVLLITAVLMIAVLAFLYHIRSNHCVLYYYGSAPAEVPGGKVIVFLNPLRNRTDEGNAEWLIRDLRTARCEEILRKEVLAEPSRVCPTMHGNNKARLIWLDPENDTIKGIGRKLVYDLPDEGGRLIVWFGPDEPGWLLKSISVVR